MRDYIETHSGRKVFLPNCEPHSIDIEDIAHALSLSPRFAGHIKQHYSVAEHSMQVASLVQQPQRLQALLHDATEAYICDIPTPFKRLMPQYKVFEDDLWNAVSLQFGVPFDLHPDVKYADRVMLLTERDYLKDKFEPWSDEYENTPRLKKWKPMRMWFGLRRATPSYIKGKFLDKFDEYSETSTW